MSSLANWSYTAICTLWRNLGIDENGDPIGWSKPISILCDYQGNSTAKIGNIGIEINIKNTFWTEYAEAKRGDYIAIGESAYCDPVLAGADEIMQVIRYADTFERAKDDFAIITGA